MWDVRFLLSYLPPLSDFVLFCLTTPTSPKIGHHLCMFPYLSEKYGTFKRKHRVREVTTYISLTRLRTVKTKLLVQLDISVSAIL